jgi:Rrf2 family protein
MRLLPRTSTYALRAVLYITATGREQKFIPIRQISDNLNISFHFLTKIFQTLSHHGLMTSYRGPAGGVALAKPASEISLIEIITALEGIDFFEGCILALPNCCDETPCPLHDYWGKMRDELKDMFEKTSLDELSKKIKNNGLRLNSIEELN